MAVDRVTTYKIYVGNVPPDAKNEDIQKIFEEFGTVVECDTLGKRAFVHMEDDIEGKHAVGELQDRELNGVKLSIQEARKNEMPRIPTVKLLVKNVSSSVDARGLRNMFKRFGCVVEVELENGEGFVCLEAIGDIRSAIKDMNGYKIDDMELSVEPAPIPASTETEASTSYSTSPKKDSLGSSWTPVEPESEQDYYDAGGYGQDSYNNHSPWMFQSRSPFQQAEPERILRDPYARGRARGRGGGGFGGSMGQRRPPPRMMPPLPPSQFHDASMGGRVMRSGMSVRGHAPPLWGGGPPPQYNPWDTGYNYDESAFYEDEPVTVVPRSNMMPSAKRNFTEANSMPLGSSGTRPVYRDPGFRGRNNGNNKRGGGRGRGGGRPSKFTALTEEVIPGEKYPVPPEFNPGFRAPWKRPKEEVKKKHKKKKQPLVPAELPDYSVPCPDLPKETVPEGAVLTPFPPPQGQSISVINSDTFGGNGSASFFGQQDAHQNDQGSSSQMDFTTDECA